MQELDEAAALDEKLAELRSRSPDAFDRARPFEALARAIVWTIKLPAETVVLEASAGPRRPMADVMEEEERLRRAELDRASEQAQSLENGLRLAFGRGGGELPLDSRDPVEDRLAGALISLLVAGNLATVRTEELGDEQYRYYVAVDWPRLDRIAERLDLPPLARLLSDSRSTDRRATGGR